MKTLLEPVDVDLEGGFPVKGYDDTDRDTALSKKGNTYEEVERDRERGSIVGNNLYARYLTDPRVDGGHP